METTAAATLRAPLLSAPARPPRRSVLLTAAPLLLAIAGSALTPLPCAFSLAGVGGGTCLLIAIAVANDYTSVLMVRAASRLGGSGYEEVILAAGGPRALRWCRVALVLLLFGTLCGCLAAIQETSTRALSALYSPSLAADPWVSSSLLIAATYLVLLPLSLASLGDLPWVAVLGVTMEICLAIYVVVCAATTEAPKPPAVALRTAPATLTMSEAAATFGYAFYIQPCAVPMLRTLPPGDDGARTLCAALHVTFAVTCVAYLCVGLGGVLLFGEGHVPQDLLQGFDGVVGGSLAAFFALYLMLAFSPTLIPLRETLVRMFHEHLARRRQGAQQRASGTAGGGFAPPPQLLSAEGDAVLPPLWNALLTTALISAALAIALLLPNASASLFALTGATGVCAIGYAFPIYAYWKLPPEFGGVAAVPSERLASKRGEPYNPMATPMGTARRPRWLQALGGFPFFTHTDPVAHAAASPRLGSPLLASPRLGSPRLGPTRGASPRVSSPLVAAVNTSSSSVAQMPPLPPSLAGDEYIVHAAKANVVATAAGDDGDNGSGAVSRAMVWGRNMLISRAWPASVLLLGLTVSALTLLAIFDGWMNDEQQCAVVDQLDELP